MSYLMYSYDLNLLFFKYICHDSTWQKLNIHQPLLLMRYFLQDPAYKTKERRWKELHHLLGHIKALIMVYDNEPMQTDNS